MLSVPGKHKQQERVKRKQKVGRVVICESPADGHAPAESYLLPPCTPPSEDLHMGGWEGKDTGGNISIRSGGQGVTAKAECLLGHHRAGAKAGNRDRAGEGRSSGNLVSGPKDWGNQGVNIWSYTWETPLSQGPQNTPQDIFHMKSLIFNYLSQRKIVLRWQKQANKWQHIRSLEGSFPHQELITWFLDASPLGV